MFSDLREVHAREFNFMPIFQYGDNSVGQGRVLDGDFQLPLTAATLNVLGVVRKSPCSGTIIVGLVVLVWKVWWAK